MKPLAALLAAGALLAALLVPAPPARANGVGTVYATTARGTVIEFDPGGGTVVDEIQGIGSGRLAFAPDARTLYIAVAPADLVVAFDIESLTTGAAVEVGGGPYAVVRATTRPAVYVGTRAGDVVTIETERHQRAAAARLDAPVTDLAVSPSDALLAAYLDTGDLVLLRLPDLGEVARTRVPGEPVAVLATQHVSGTIQTGAVVRERFWAVTGSGIVSAFDEQLRPIRTVKASGSVRDAAVGGAMDRILLAGGSGVVDAIDTDLVELAGTLFVGAPVAGVVVDTDSERAYVTVPSRSQMLIFSVSRLRLLRTITSQDLPEHLAASPLRIGLRGRAYTTLPHTGTRAEGGR